MRVLRLSLAISALLLVTVMAACKDDGLQELPGRIIYPEGWPLPELTVPYGAKPAFLSGTTKRSNGEHVRGLHNISANEHEESSPPYTEWAIGFNTQLSHKEVYKHIDDCLKPLGYSAVMTPEAGHPQLDITRGFLAPDRCTLVIVFIHGGGACDLHITIADTQLMSPEELKEISERKVSEFPY